MIAGQLHSSTVLLLITWLALFIAWAALGLYLLRRRWRRALRQLSDLERSRAVVDIGAVQEWHENYRNEVQR